MKKVDGAEMNEWFLCFKFKHGHDNRDTVMRSFMNFYSNPDKEMWIPPGRCMLGGRVYGSDLFPDKTPIMTSRIQMIVKADKTEVFFGSLRVLFKAITGSDREYFFYSDEKSPFMFIMMGDLTHLNMLSKKPDRYIPPEYRAKGLL